MASGMGWTFRIVHIHHHHNAPGDIVLRQVYWARYVDWAITTPLILLDLTILAGLPGVEILLALVADIAMVLFVRLPHPTI